MLRTSAKVTRDKKISLRLPERINTKRGLQYFIPEIGTSSDLIQTHVKVSPVWNSAKPITRTTSWYSQPKCYIKWLKTNCYKITQTKVTLLNDNSLLVIKITILVQIWWCIWIFVFYIILNKNTKVFAFFFSENILTL